MNASLLRGIRGERNTISLEASASSLLHANDPKDGSDAYAWKYEDPQYTIGLTAGFSSLRCPAWRLFGSGAEIVGMSRVALTAKTYRAYTVFRAAFEPILPVRIAAYAVFDEEGTALDGTSLAYGETSFDGMREYAEEAPSELKRLAGVNTELRLSPHFWAAWKLSNLDDENAGNDYSFGFTLDLAW